MASSGTLVIAVLITAVLTATITRPVLHRLPEPSGPDATDKINYGSLAEIRFELATVALSLAAATVAWACLPVAVQAPWTVLAVIGVLLAAIDAVTTWLPLRLTRIGWLAMALACATLPFTADLNALVRAAAGAAIAGFAYLLLWWVSRGAIGFGDVRFAPLLGAAAGAVSWPVLLWALLAGSLAGGVWGLVRLVRRRPGPFAYAPPMLLGCYLAVAVSALG